MHYYKPKNEEEADVPGGIGEEDFLTLVLPYKNCQGTSRLPALTNKGMEKRQ